MTGRSAWACRRPGRGFKCVNHVILFAGLRFQKRQTLQRFDFAVARTLGAFGNAGADFRRSPTLPWGGFHVAMFIKVQSACSTLPALIKAKLAKTSGDDPGYCSINASMHPFLSDGSNQSDSASKARDIPL